MRYIILTVLFLLLISACAHDRPNIETEDAPFIVYKIEKYNETHNLYYSEHFTTLNMLAMRRPAVLAPSGYMSIGDTLKIVKQQQLKTKER